MTSPPASRCVIRSGRPHARADDVPRPRGSPAARRAPRQSSAADVTGRSQTWCRQTYAAGAPVDGGPTGQQRDVVAAGRRPPPRPHPADAAPPPPARRAPGRTARRRRPPRGPSSIASAAARLQPANRGARGARPATVASASSAACAVPPRPGEGGVRRERVDRGRLPRRAGVVGGVARPGDQRLGVVGGVEEAAVLGAEAGQRHRRAGPPRRAARRRHRWPATSDRKPLATAP